LGIATLGSAAADGPKPALPDADYTLLVEPSARLIQEALAGQPNRRVADKARVAALMLAEFAQQNLAGLDAEKRASIRDAAVAIARLIHAKEYAAAAKEAARLPSLPANPKAKKERLKLMGPHLDIEDLMTQFRAAKAGGLGIEALLDQLATEKNETVSAAAMTDELRLLAYRTAVAGEMAREHVPKMKVKEWQAYADDMRKSAVGLAEAVQAKDGKKAYAAVERLNTSCNQCHKEFRN
jgi:hypothetical protein